MKKLEIDNSESLSKQIVDQIFKQSVMNDISDNLELFLTQRNEEKCCRIAVSQITRDRLNRLKIELSKSLKIQISQEDMIIMACSVTSFLFRKLNV